MNMDFYYSCHDVGLGCRFMKVINTSFPPFSSLYPTEVTFAKPLVNIEILGTSEGGGKLTIFWQSDQLNICGGT
jgi:hypothetical protein